MGLAKQEDIAIDLTQKKLGMVAHACNSSLEDEEEEEEVEMEMERLESF